MTKVIFVFSLSGVAKPMEGEGEREKGQKKKSQAQTEGYITAQKYEYVRERSEETAR